MLQLLKAALPGSIPFLIAAIVIGMILLYSPRHKTIGRNWLLSTLVLYMVFGIPASARFIAAPLGWGQVPLQSLAMADNARAIIVLDGGTGRFGSSDEIIETPLKVTILRALETIRVYSILDRPLVLVSGGTTEPGSSWAAEASVLRDLLLEAGIPEDRVVLDSKSVNTRAHAVNLMRMIKQRGIERFVLVTSPNHMRRAVWAFQAEGGGPIASPSQGMLDHLHGWQAFWPTTSALEFTQATMHEYIGIAYYFTQQYF